VVFRELCLEFICKGFQIRGSAHDLHGPTRHQAMLQAEHSGRRQLQRSKQPVHGRDGTPGYECDGPAELAFKPGKKITQAVADDDGLGMVRVIEQRAVNVEKQGPVAAVHVRRGLTMVERHLTAIYRRSASGTTLLGGGGAPLSRSSSSRLRRRAASISMEPAQR